ncbi:hypothetical protein P170DRAFT_475961 [Aspergillus steynii IBT 23096]|uniref:Uncharacterized protein n=1 Tax=Aspergillus steynii IBT 23096 TaxID=1392250 RepID=A0A2I2G9V8_9EURO|nr:uncharacterized protein P170DRAFT_475961 [Aspergillus steynii IBT 23096]PLB49667.1 hypothetical protein P170DRAFT_475961 [Aspergillus steynii IBT 23096]
MSILSKSVGAVHELKTYTSSFWFDLGDVRNGDRRPSSPFSDGHCKKRPFKDRRSKPYHTAALFYLGAPRSRASLSLVSSIHEGTGVKTSGDLRSIVRSQDVRALRGWQAFLKVDPHSPAGGGFQGVGRPWKRGQGDPEDWLAEIVEASPKWTVDAPIHAIRMNEVKVGLINQVSEDTVQVDPLSKPLIQSIMIPADKDSLTTGGGKFRQNMSGMLTTITAKYRI